MRNIFQFLDRRLIAFCHDAVMVMLAWVIAYEVHLDLSVIPRVVWIHALSLIPVVLLLQVGFFILLGLYRSVWRFASIPDLIQIIKAVGLGVISAFFYTDIMSQQSIPRSIPVLYGIFLVLFLSFGRLGVRWHKDRRNYFSSDETTKRVLIVGSGDVAEGLLREMLRDVRHQYYPVAIIDSDYSTLNREIHRVRVVGTLEQIKLVVEKYCIEIVFIALSDVSNKKMNFILQACNSLKIPCRIIPDFRHAARGEQLLSSMRQVNVDDLLGRETYAVDRGLFQQSIQGKKVLVTGGGGSIGSELCREIASLNPAQLLIIDQSEINLYRIDMELRDRFPQLNLQIILFDILNADMLETFFDKHRPQLVFHAAAYKHVPMLENQVQIAVRNNVMGSKYVVDMAVKYQAEIFVQVSTDKAVNPTNVMGLTKRVAEIYCQNLSYHTATKIMTVRFGNVLGSVGSVVPLFTEQLRRGGPLTVTHPDIMRYFMTIPEACRLILQAMIMGEGGEIFVLDMGEPIKIKDLAEQMIRLTGKKVDEDIKIIYTGLRPGEKLHEELFYANEAMTKTQHKKIYRAESVCFDSSFIHGMISSLAQYCKAQDDGSVLSTLLEMVPEYQGNRKKLFAETSYV